MFTSHEIVDELYTATSKNNHIANKLKCSRRVVDKVRRLLIETGGIVKKRTPRKRTFWTPPMLDTLKLLVQDVEVSNELYLQLQICYILRLMQFSSILLP